MQHAPPDPTHRDIAGEHERTLTLTPGVGLSYRLWRPGPPRQLLVLIHGMGSNLTRWSEFLEHTTLKRDWDILRLDLRGHGRSPFRGRLDMEAWCADIAAVLDAEGYREAVVVGHSLGALVAVWFALLHPACARALVLVEPSFPEAARGATRVMRRLRPLIYAAIWLARGLNALGLRRRRFVYRDLRELDERTRRELLSVGKREAMIRRYASPWLDLRFNPSANYLQDLLQVVRPLPPMTGIHIPVLTLLSTDTRFSDGAVTRRILAQLPHPEIRVLPATHWLMTETPTEARQAIDSWCASLGTQAA